MDRMRRPEARAVLLSVALVGIGSMGGAFLDRLSFPHVARMFNTCASSKQFLTEFRLPNYGYWMSSQLVSPSMATIVLGVSLEVDGKSLGSLAAGGSVRYFLCEGNHRARVGYRANGDNTTLETHTADFAVSRPSLFELRQVQIPERDSSDCNSAEPCDQKIQLTLSPYEPDDPKVRVYPEQTSR